MTEHYTVGEISKIYNISVHTLRFYDKKGVFQPSTKNEVTGYRYYTPDQLYQLELLLFLRELGFPVHDMKCLMEQVSTRSQLQEVLRKQQSVIQNQIDALTAIRDKLTQVDGKFSNLLPDLGVIRRRWVTSRVFMPMYAPDLPADGPERKFKFKEIVERNSKFLSSFDMVPEIRGTGAVAYRKDFQEKGRIHYNYIFVEMGNMQLAEGAPPPTYLEAGNYLTCRFSGEEGNRLAAYQQMEAYIRQHDLKVGPWYIEDGVGTGLPPIRQEDEITELQILLLDGEAPKP